MKTLHAIRRQRTKVTTGYANNGDVTFLRAVILNVTAVYVKRYVVLRHNSQNVLTPKTFNFTLDSV